MISRCNSPIPEIIVWPVSSSVLTLNVGSSSASFDNAIPIFSWSFLVFGSTATEITGSGNSICSRTIGASSAQRVSPVVVSFNPTAAAISPQYTCSISSLLLACIWSILPILSFLPFVELRTVAPFSTKPAYTLKNVNLPTNGSVITLKASDAKGASSDISLSIRMSGFLGSLPSTIATSVGAGI